MSLKDSKGVHRAVEVTPAAGPVPSAAGAFAPRHCAIIMDGNGRWAQRRGLPRLAGHRAGAEALERVVRAAPGLGIEVLTAYTFSTENWRRPASEVFGIMQLLVEFLRRKAPELAEEGVRLRVLGDIARLPRPVQSELDRAQRITRTGTGLTLVLALNYGGRWELAVAARRLAEEVRAGTLDPADIDEARLGAALPGAEFGAADLIIRPGGEHRLSNFLLWSAAYSEIVVTETLWPDFGPEALGHVVAEYGRRERRFGGIQHG